MLHIQEKIERSIARACELAQSWQQGSIAPLLLG